MPFGKVSKEDLIAAGLNPDEISASLKAVKDGSASKEDLTKVTTALDAITETLKGLEGKFAQPVTRNEPNIDPNKNQQKTPEELEEERRNEFLTDPTKYVDTQVQNLGFAAKVEFKKASLKVALKDAKRTLPGFNNPTLAAEIEEEMKKYPAEAMARSNADPEIIVQQVHDMIIGKHHNDIMQDRDKKDGKYNLVHSGGGGGGAVDDSNRNSSSNEPTVKPEIEAQAKRFGMTGAEWLKEQTEMNDEEKTRFVKVGA